MVASVPLSTAELDEARAEVAAGRALTVWFTPAAVGVPAGGSARVVSVGDPGDGDFIQVKPAGSRDTVFCSPGELTRTRPARKRAAKAPAEPPAASDPASGPAPEPAPVPDPAPEPTYEPAYEPAAPPRAPARPRERPAPAPEAERPVAPARRSAARPAEITVTLNATAEGEWSVEVVLGKKRTVRPTPVSPAEVAKAARALPEAVAEAIESSLDAARQRQLDRVEQLRAELEAAQRALQDLTG